jgi:hypothetical protein
MCGIGGRTIAEAQQRISYPEFVRWARYRAKRGSLHLGLRVERGTAMLAALYANAHRKEHTPAYQLHDFAPYHDQPELTLDDLKSWV